MAIPFEPGSGRQYDIFIRGTRIVNGFPGETEIAIPASEAFLAGFLAVSCLAFTCCRPPRRLGCNVCATKPDARAHVSSDRGVKVRDRVKLCRLSVLKADRTGNLAGFKAQRLEKSEAVN